MALLTFWKKSPEDVLAQRIEQVVSNAGDGNILDGSRCSVELRTYFSECPSANLFLYVQQCLKKSFPSSGLVLQDLVNEIGRRLDFDVEHGLYRGKPSAIGFDGIWRAPGEPDLIIEVKTTDYITMDLETSAGYKERLLTAGRTVKKASTLIVVLREDTNALEAQIRGSRYAWEMRLISVESLVKLLQIKEKSDDKATVSRIRQLLQPFEYTKIDRIIDVIFTTTHDVEIQHETEQEVESEATSAEGEIKGGKRIAGRQMRTNLELLNAKRQQAVDSFAATKDVPLIKRSTTLFSSPDKTFRVCCAVSKRYANDYHAYWYAFHPSWKEFLDEGKTSFFILCCMDRDEAFAIPYKILLKNLKNLNMTDRGERSYWHVPITILDRSHLAINTNHEGAKVGLSPMSFELKAAERHAS